MKRGNRFFKLTLASILALATVGAAFGAGPKAATTTSTVVKPESVGMDGKVLDEGIGRVVQTYIDNKTIPGAVVLVARHGKICYFKAFGEKQKGVPMTTDSVFSLVSMSKSPVAAAAMRLVDEGRITLTDPISMYMPEFAHMTVAVKATDGSVKIVPAEREITLHDLLSMTAGIWRPVGSTGDKAKDAYSGDPVKDFVGEMMRDAGIKTGTGDYDYTAEENAKRLAKIPLICQPGSAFVYTDPSADVLGRLIEVVAGKPLDKVLEDEIFKPLGMKDSSFYPPEKDLDRIPSMMWGGGPGTPDGKLGQWWDRTFENGGYGCCPVGLEGAYGKNKNWFSAAGGLFSTSYDFFRFGQMMLNGGVLDGKRVLSTQAVKRMTTNQIGTMTNTFWNNRWGYMLDIQEDNIAKPPYYNANGATGAYGWMGAAGTRWYASPEEDTVVVFMSQLWFLWNIIPASDRIVSIVNSSIM